ncbi:cysteine--tRNA ligase [Aminobacter sp. MDW-2]|uniref:cysteine--tRNA ligase n=1 Tax=Aminobacter sp. MDW-2 TaxID=2666139 RepID=UPI0012AF6859|nr:cysteine--tRNA ligase [Aminobacter sp. MDW-2]MRX33465.1 cysteine--tRNA ligase [Aminobacter sp. MDW-2]QNH33479.1 cysteine--tRNA ligase [Aminobacter sp. MDW-2]
MSDAFKGLRLTNTLTRTKEDFVPIDPQNVRMYVCGPTVYDFAHIGNARPAIVFDVLFRLLRHVYGDDHVTYVRNLTDLDDKINARALRDFPDLPLNEAIRRVTEKTANQYQADVKALGCLEPSVEPRATEFVLARPDGKTDMVSLIQRLIERGHAYEAQGEVLFDTGSMEDYGQLSKRNLDEQQAGARVEVEAHKKNPGDFVLWKASSPEEPGWDSPWGRGRPGWHIECSAMSAAYLGEVFDIHGGGLDLIFPHHENEIAQSRCAHGTEVMANYWLHNGFLQVEGQKMSKSLGNFYSIHELLATENFGGRTWPGEVLRLAMLMTHYREPIDFSLRKLEEAENTLRKWKRAADSAGEAEAEVPAALIAALSDDLATSSVFQGLSQLAGEAAGNVQAAAELKAALLFLGFGLEAAAVDEAAVAVTIARRLELINAKNWAEADRIRDELLAQGVQLKDGKDAVTGERVTTWEVKR